jgi:flagellar assembly factor FliW
MSETEPVTFESVRFGTLQVTEQEVIEFPFGLIGLGGSRYTLIDRNPGSGFLWLHSIEDPALALPVVDPESFFSPFSFEIVPEDLERIGREDLSAALVYVTVRAMPNPLEMTANLRAPLVMHAGKGFQVLNASEGASLREPLFELAGEQSAGKEPQAAA